MTTDTVNDNSRHVYSVSRLNELGIPVEIVCTAPDLETAVDFAEAMGSEYVAATWSYRVN